MTSTAELSVSAAAAEGLTAALRAAGVPVDDSALIRSLYATDASIYRIPPVAVATPRHSDEVASALQVARGLGVSVTMRGAGTSIAGNAIGSGLVIDTSRHLNAVVSVDPETATAVVEPGVVHAALQRAAAPHGLRFGPDPSTHTRCTIGGMIGNNACGSRALGYGRTADNVLGLEALLSDGRPAKAVAAELAQLVDANLEVIRTRFGTFGRQVSGYSLEHLLPERGRSVDRFLVGSEGTLAVVTQATVRLVHEPAFRALAVLGYPGMAEAADDVPALLAHKPVACEGMDRRITDLVPRKPRLPRGDGWLLVEVAGDEAGQVAAAAAAIVKTSAAVDSRLVTDVAEQAALWRIREDGAGTASRATQPPGQAGWEDAAVPPARLGQYLREFDQLLLSHGLTGAPYGHFGDGCVHVRVNFDLERGVDAYGSFVNQAARLVAAHGGSLSGEHGDGRARSALLPVMYDDHSIKLFAGVKAIFDPDNVLNPGVLVDPAPVTADIRLASLGQRPRTFLTLSRDGGDLTDALHRCTGVGKCRADNTGTGAVMCPSFQATRDEKDSTRGRARVLQDVVAGRLNWRDEAVGEALDLCLACKGCANDCPTGVDMATYKAEALHQRYQGRIRPLTHYTLGRLPQLLVKLPPRIVNLAMTTSPRLAKALAGVDRRRKLPGVDRLPAHRRKWPEVEHPDVVLWADTFTNRFTPEVVEAALKVLSAAGQQVRVVALADECCGLTLISTGQLTAARKTLQSMMGALAVRTPEGVPVVALEPSCLAVLRVDSHEVIAEANPEVARLIASVRTLAEHLGQIGWQPPDLSGVEIVAQPHCHHASVLGWEADAALLAQAGAQPTRVGGCCGLAGNFGMEKGHYEVSVAVFEHDLGPALAAAPEAVVLTDGFSCRTQVSDLTGRESVHLAQLLADSLPDGPRFDPPESSR